MRQPTGTWKGGRTYENAEGERRYIIRKTIDGIAYNLTLEADSEKAADLEYRAFRQDPVAYKAQHYDAEQFAVRLDPDRVSKFLDYLETEGRTSNYRRDARSYLAEWDEALRGRDLRALDSKATKKVLAGWDGARRHRIIVFKSFCSWLVDEGELDPVENPGRFLTVPPARRTHETKGYTIRQVEALYAVLPTQPVRDVLRLQSATGMHCSEVERLAKGQGTVRDLKGAGDIAGTITFVHKTGRRKIISLGAAALAAAKRLQEHGRAPDRKGIHAAAKVAVKRQTAAALAAGEKDPKVVKVNFGALRHSFSTWLLECGTVYHPKGTGLPLEVVAEALGHTNSRTTALHYISAQVPPLYKVPINLIHPDDPSTLEVADAGAKVLPLPARRTRR